MSQSADTQRSADKLCSDAHLIISRNEIRVQPHQETLDLNESILHLNSADREHRSREVSETHNLLHTADVHQQDIREETHLRLPGASGSARSDGCQSAKWNVR